MPETMMEALGRYARENEALRAALADEQAAHATTTATLATTTATLATRTTQLATRTAQRDALAADNVALIVGRDDWRDKAQALKIASDIIAPENDEGGVPGIFRLGRRIARTLGERDQAQAAHGMVAAQLSDAVREIAAALAAKAAAEALAASAATLLAERDAARRERGNYLAILQGLGK